MIAAVPAQRVAEILVGAGYRKIPLPLQVAGSILMSRVPLWTSAIRPTWSVIGDMAADGERKVLQQIEASPVHSM